MDHRINSLYNFDTKEHFCKINFSYKITVFQTEVYIPKVEVSQFSTVLLQKDPNLFII